LNGAQSLAGNGAPMIYVGNDASTSSSSQGSSSFGGAGSLGGQDLPILYGENAPLAPENMAPSSLSQKISTSATDYSKFAVSWI
jgi:hypothetical protein